MIRLLQWLLGENLGSYFLVIETGVFRGGKPHSPYDGEHEALECECQDYLLPKSNGFRLVSHAASPER